MFQETAHHSTTRKIMNTRRPSGRLPILTLTLALACFLGWQPPTWAGEQQQLCDLYAPQQLSDIGVAVLDEIFETPGALEKSPTEEAYLLTTCNRLESVLVDGPEIFGAARDLIAEAEHEVAMAFFGWGSGHRGCRPDRRWPDPGPGEPHRRRPTPGAPRGRRHRFQ